MNRLASGFLSTGFVIGVVFSSRFAEAKPNLGKKLLAAAQDGETPKVLELLGQGADPNYSDKQGCTPLIVAAGGCAYSGSIDAKGVITSTPVVSRGTVEMVRALLAAGATPNVADANGTSALMFAARFGLTESVSALLDAHANPNFTIPGDMGALHWAARAGNLQVVTLLVQGGATVDARNKAQATPLGLAVSEGSLEVVRFLLTAGANAKAVDVNGQTCLIAAAYEGHVEIMNALVAAGVDVNARDKYGTGALSNAAYMGQFQAATWLLDHGADVNARDDEGNTPLSYATKRRHPDVAALLKTKGGIEGVPLLLGSGAIAADLKGNIPAKRLKGDTYSSPDGSFDLTVPPLLTPGAKAEERQLGQGEMTVVFYDDIGEMYYVIWTDNRQLKSDVEQIAAGYTINESLREKQIVPTPRGSELRIALVRAGASPMVKETTVDGKITRTKLDLYEAHSLFVTDQYVYEVTAGVTAVHQRSDAELFALAKEHLDAFLGGLRIKAAAAPPGN